MRNKKDAIITAVIFVTGIFLLAWNIGHESFWADEAFTGVMIRHSFADIYEFCKMEMHSAFYYWMLKIFSLIFGSGEISLRVFSLLGTLALAGLGPTAIKRLFNPIAGWMFSAAVFLAPGLVAYSQEARMYTWGAFFTTAMALYAFLAQREGKRRDMILFGVFLFCAMYTHLLGMVSSFFFNAIFLSVLLFKKNYSFIKKYLITAGIVAVLFLPRLYYVIEQAKIVKKNFWIGPVTKMKIIQSIQFVFGLKFDYDKLTTVISIIVILSVLITLIYLIIKKDKNSGLLLTLLSSYVAAFLFLIFYSYAISPILEPRYTLIFAPWLIAVFACGLYRFHKIAGIAVITLYCILSFSVNLNTYNKRYNGYMKEAVEDIKNRIKPDHVFVHVGEHTLGAFTYYFPEHKHYFLINKRSKVYWYLEIFKKYGGYGPELKDLIGDAKNIWIADRMWGFNTGVFDKQFYKLGTPDYSATYMQEPKHSWFTPFVKYYKID
ncbi:MAG: glycosyltransferase family 39 protein [Spirochaetes bacterium]|nr:glycosyltransferase family 39 protein [Spirochaetota bacterium]MBN2769640.1 glycosyltransferase family 39 protein [Spirochaetota bacterium]